MKTIILFASLMFGAIFGSLFNVLIYRLPRNKSIVSPGSQCPNCGHKIKPHENIPIISYILLKGKCSNCKTKISVRYPLVEALTSVYFTICVYFFYIRNNQDLSQLNIKDAITTTEAIIFGSILIVQSFIDMDWFILLDDFNYYGLIIGFLFSLSGYGLVDVKSSIIGILVGGFLPFTIYYIYLRIKKIEALGMGDVKLLAMIGAFGGPYMVLSSMFFGSITGLAVSIPTILRNKNIQYYIPFGPFLSIGAVVWLFAQHVILKHLFY